MFIKFSYDVGDPSYFSMSLSDCLCHVLFRRYPLSLEVVKKPNRCIKILVPFLWGTTPTFLRRTVIAIYCPPFGKVWLSSVCWSPSAKPGNEAECRIYGGWVKNSGPILSRLWTNVHVVSRRCRITPLVANALVRLSVWCYLPKT